jgi:hypothetical protein
MIVKWISIKNALPVENSLVLIAIIGEKIDHIKISMYDNEFLDEHGILIQNVSYWLKIPELPND